MLAFRVPTTDAEIGKIEHLKNFGQRVSKSRHGDAAPIFPIAKTVVGGQGGLKRPSPATINQLSADLEQGVAQALGVEAAPVRVSQQPVLRVSVHRPVGSRVRAQIVPAPARALVLA